MKNIYDFSELALEKEETTTYTLNKIKIKEKGQEEKDVYTDKSPSFSLPFNLVPLGSDECVVKKGDVIFLKDRDKEHGMLINSEKTIEDILNSLSSVVSSIDPDELYDLIYNCVKQNEITNESA